MRPTLARLLIVLAGILFGQAVLYGPSLVGRRILLPLDILARPGIYLPAAPGITGIEPHNLYRSDLIYLCEPARRFAHSELRAGRLPMWIPSYFAGAPFIWPKFSPFFALQCSVESPVILAWAQLVAAAAGGLGAYLFFRRALRVSFWSAALAGWCYPLTGFFIFWQGYPTALAVHWLPWEFLMVNATVRGTSRLAPVGLSVVTGLVLVSGHLDVAGQVLLASGLFALWCWFDAYRWQWLERPACKRILALSLGWGFGFLLAAPYVLPVLDYTHTGVRMARRGAGDEERPPVGLSALPQVVLPDLYGSFQTGSYRLSPENEMESSAAAYTGLFATLLVAPLAWCDRRRHSINTFWAFLAFVGVGWCLNIPGLVHLLRLPGLNMFSHNRFVFAASFAILAMTAVGLDTLRAGPIPWRRGLYLPVLILAMLGAWSAYRLASPPEMIDTQLTLEVLAGTPLPGIPDLPAVHRIQSWFTWHYGAAAVFCGLALLGWWLVWSGHAWKVRLFPFLVVSLLGDLLWFGHGRSAQCAPTLYFPRQPALDEVAHSEPGRVMGYYCLPANVAAMCGLRDVRGYDSVDPATYVELAELGADSTTVSYPYARLQFLQPKTQLDKDGNFRLWPVFDLLGVTHVIFRGSPPAGMQPLFQSPDYWVLANSNALPRAFVPHRVEVVAEPGARLAKLGARDFQPREVAYLERPVSLPSDCRGKAEIVAELPTRLTIALQMETAGLVVLADLWEAGWHAYLNGKPVPVLRANHALRGVVVPAGPGRLEFRYAPASYALGLKLAAGTAALLMIWLGIFGYRRWRKPSASTQ